MKNKKFIFHLSIFLLVIILFPIEKVYGHGWGLDTTSIDIDGREISVSVELPMYYDETTETVISITAIDKATKKNVENVTFLIGLSHNDKFILRNYFFTADGNLLINVLPTTEGETKILAEKDPLLGAWYATESHPIQLQGPIFDSGGLFNFEIELRTIDEPDNIVENLGIYYADVSIVETKSFEVITNEEETIFKTKSYFDKISSFSFDEKNNLLSFEMPFDWSEKTISHIPVVHVEVHFPKDYATFLSPSYVGKINDIELFKSNVVIDDYTEENERIVHYVILQDHLQYLKQEQKRKQNELPEKMVFSLQTGGEIVFPMTAFTRDEKFQVDLSWDPIEIEPNKKTRFVFTIRDASTAEPLRQSTYDFIILQKNVEIYKKSGNAEIGGKFEEFTFLESQSGPTVIRFDNIRGTGSSTEFGLVVVPEFGFLAFMVLASGLIFIITINKKLLKF